MIFTPFTFVWIFYFCDCLYVFGFCDAFRRTQYTTRGLNLFSFLLILLIRHLNSCHRR